MKRHVGTWIPPSRCVSFWSWIHQNWTSNQHWESPDCLIVELWTRWFGFEFMEEKSMES
jgi:hypothetical protein